MCRNAFLVHYSFKNNDSSVFIPSIIFLVISIVIHIFLNLIVYICEIITPLSSISLVNGEETKYIFSKDLF